MLYTYIFGFFVALLLSLVFTPIVRVLSIKYGQLAASVEDRWHKIPTPALGGIGIWISFVITVMFLTHIHKFWNAPLLNPPVISSKYLYLTLAGGSGIFILGLIDDFFKLNPQIKLVSQVVIATVMVKFGIVVEIIPYAFIAIPLTIFWIVAITNAFNLLDNMDGLSSGIAGISSLIMFAFSIQSGNYLVAVLSLPLAGASFGFLVFNFNPAKIFMGDSGSLFLGFYISVFAVIGTWKDATNLIVTIIPPLLVLGIPLFDTMFVTVTRRLRGQPVSQGGKDHISHRLVSLGLSERRAVLVLYSISILFGALGLFFSNVTPLVILVLAVIVAVGLFFSGMFFREIGQHETYFEDKKVVIDKTEVNSKHKSRYQISRRTIVEILMDLILISTAYFSSYLIRTEGILEEPFFETFIESCPYVIIVKSIVFYIMGLYKSNWRYISVQDLIGIIKAVTISSLIVVFAAFMFARFSYGYSRSVFIIDWMLTLIMIGGSRCVFRAFRELIINHRVGGENTLIIGAGNAGELILKEIRNNPLSGLRVIGFIDDDLLKCHKKIHGVKVYGTTGELAEIANKLKVKEVIIAMPSESDKVILRIENLCYENGLNYGTMPLSNSSILDKLIQPGVKKKSKPDGGVESGHSLELRNFISEN